MKTIDTDLRKPTFWQQVFSRSIINGAPYKGDQLPGRNWNWPKDTYLQRRLREVKWYQSSENAEFN